MRAPRRNLTSLGFLQVMLLAAHGNVGCMGESVPIGAMDAAAGEGASDGAPNTGGSASGSAGKGGTAGKGGSAAQGNAGGGGESFGRGGTSAGGGAGSAAVGGNGGNAGSAGGGDVGGTAGTEGGGEGGSLAGSAGGGAVGGTTGTAGDAGSAGSAGSGLTGGEGGSAGGGFAGSAGSAGGWNDPVGPWSIGAPNDVGCMSGAPCTAWFQWRDSTIPVGTWMGDYYFRDLSADGLWLVGMLDGGGASQGGFKFTWDATELELLLNGDPISPTAVSADGSTSVGWSVACRNQNQDCSTWAVIFTGAGPTKYFQDVPIDHYGAAVSSDGSVMVARAMDATGSYVLRNGTATLMTGVALDAISRDGQVFGGQRTSGGAVIVDGTSVIDVPSAGDWIPYTVTALNEDGSVAVGYAEDQSGLPLYPTQAFRWVRGSELTLLGIPEGMDSSAAEDCDASGELVVGSSYAPDHYEPFVYRPNAGLHTLRDDLLTHSVPLVPAQLQMSGLRVSADGTRIAGAGARGTYNIVWVADYLTGPALVPGGDP